MPEHSRRRSTKNTTRTSKLQGNPGLATIEAAEAPAHTIAYILRPGAHPLSARSIGQLQRTIGNQAVRRLLAPAAPQSGDATQRIIESQQRTTLPSSENGGLALQSSGERDRQLPIQRTLKIGDVEYRKQGTIKKHLPVQTANYRAILNILIALGQSNFTVSFDSWEAAINRAFEYLAHIIVTSEDFNMNLLEKDGLDSYDITMINAAIFGFDHRTAEDFMLLFYNRGLWDRGNITLRVDDAVLSPRNPYVPIYFLFRRSQQFGTHEIHGIGLNAHAEAADAPYPGSTWLVGYHGFSLERNDIGALDNVIQSLYASSPKLRAEVARVAQAHRQRQLSFGEQLGQLRLGKNNL